MRRILNSISILYLRAILKWNSLRKAQKYEMRSSKYTLERTLVYGMRAEIRRQSVGLLILSGERMQTGPLGFFSALLMSTNDREGPQSVGLEVPSRYQQIGEFANMEYANNEDQPYGF